MSEPFLARIAGSNIPVICRFSDPPSIACAMLSLDFSIMPFLGNPHDMYSRCFLYPIEDKQIHHKFIRSSSQKDRGNMDGNGDEKSRRTKGNAILENQAEMRETLLDLSEKMDAIEENKKHEILKSFREEYWDE